MKQDGVWSVLLGVAIFLTIRTAALALLALGCAFGQSPSVPAAFQATYTEMQNDVASFQSTVNSQWNGQASNVLWSGGLLAANANNGLVNLHDTTGTLVELKALHALGVRSVVVNIALPILNEDFYTFNGDPEDFQSMVNVYANLADQIHQLGMKMIVESAQMYTGYFTAGSGFNLSGYYATLSDSEFVAARVKNILTVAQQVGPDYINLNSEPDTELQISGRSSLYGSASAYAAMNQSIISQLRAAGVTIPIGAGIGTWLHNGNASDWVTALLSTDISFLDLHVYPLNLNFLPNLITYADMAVKAGKPVGMAQVWDLKESTAEFQSGLGQLSSVETLYGRDPFSFWQPLDQAFLTALAGFANWKNILYVSPFWTHYFWSYLDYDQVATLPAEQVTTMENQAANAALSANQTTGTATTYSNLIGGIVQIPAVSAAHYLAGPVAPNSIVSIFGSNLANGIGTAASLPLPTKLSGATATIRDSSGQQEALPFFFVSPNQINAAIPGGLSSGIAIITFSNQGTQVAGSNVLVASVAPGVFTANQNGKGVPIGVVVTNHANGTQSSVNVYQGSSVGNYTPAPIDLGGSSDQSVLVVYGTGIRGVSSLSKVTAAIGTASAPAQFAGASDPAHFIGLDQVNIALPHSLAGAGQVNLTLTVEGVAAPPVTLDFE